MNIAFVCRDLVLVCIDGFVMKMAILGLQETRMVFPQGETYIEILQNNMYMYHWLTMEIILQCDSFHHVQSYISGVTF